MSGPYQRERGLTGSLAGSENAPPSHDPNTAPLSANATQVGGEHYKTAIQTWDFILANNIPFLEGNIIKYLVRWRTKGGVDDLKKAQHYLQKLIEVGK